MSNSENNYPLIQQYVQDLSEELAYIPQVEREQHIIEIEGHLQSLAQEKIKQGYNKEKAVVEALNEFLPANKLAEQIINEVEMMSTINGGTGRYFSNRSKTNVKAITSLVFGILSIVFMIISLLGITFAIIGLVFGFIGLNEIKRFKQEGRKMALAGVICSSNWSFITDFISYYCLYSFYEPNFLLNECFSLRIGCLYMAAFSYLC